MITVPISGTNSTVSFFEDDTIDTVRKLIALAVNSHPDRLFIEVHEEFPKNWYSNPKHWSALFYRLSYDGKTIPISMMKTYLAQTRILPSVTPHELTKDEWESRMEDLSPIFAPEDEFLEWRVIGAEISTVMPLPPKDLIDLKPTYIPLPRLSILFETAHPHKIHEIRATPIPSNSSKLILNNYFPYLVDETPLNINEYRSVIEGDRNRIKMLLELDAPKHTSTNIIKAKWYIPLISTHFSAPHVRFEQIFYGMTVSDAVPYVGYFTGKNETTRHKFFVENPKDKKPKMDTTLWKSWYISTSPQRRLPTLLFYRGTSKHSFDRIFITSKDISILSSRDKADVKGLNELKKESLEWLMSFDALVPFLDPLDISDDRFKLEDISAIATYDTKITKFDMRRFPCLKNVFNHDTNKDAFRFLRSDAAGNFSSLEVTAFEILRNADNPSAKVLEKEMNIPADRALLLYNKIIDLDADFDIEKIMKQYPVILFSTDEVIINNVKNLERTLHYVDMLRYVLTSEKEDDNLLNQVCPRGEEVVEATLAVPAKDVIEEEAYDEDLMAAFGLEEEAPTQEVLPETTTKVVPTAHEITIKQAVPATTYDYFNSLIKRFEPELNKQYPKKCEKLKQVVVLTSEKRKKIGPKYNYEDAKPEEVLSYKNIKGEEGLAICPPYWCVRDEIPLREDQLIVKEDGKHCPVCDGKVRITDKESTAEYPVITRNLTAKYPKMVEALNAPCCYVNPRKNAAVLQKGGTELNDVTYIVGPDKTLKPLRLAFIHPRYAKIIKTNYEKTVTKGHIGVGESDMFRVGIGRPSKTLPVLLGMSSVIPRPKESIENLKLCSFFRTWKNINAEGETLVDRIINSIDAAFEKGELSVFEELEYASSVLNVQVIRLVKDTVVCGFWTETTSAKSRTIVVTETGDVLARASRNKQSGIIYDADIRKDEKAYTILKSLHTQACSSNIPYYQDGIKELISLGKPAYELIADPFDRIQAILVPGKYIFPFQPASVPNLGINIRRGYEDIKTEELPVDTSYLERAIHPGFKPIGTLMNSEGMIVEILLASGFRVPVQPQESPEEGPAMEVLETLRKHPERDLIEAPPNAKDKKLAEQISYTEEVFQFLLFSLSKDIQKDEYQSLRESIASGSENLYKDLQNWAEKETYMDDANEPIQFLNKIREPCGQLKDEKMCNKSSICGWVQNSCKIKIRNTVVDGNALLRRLAKVLKDNEKQRSLVLDERLSPFFSTILYLEMPNELITTEV